MATKVGRFRVLGIIGFAALTVTLISACSGNGISAANSNGHGAAATSTAAAGASGSDSAVPTTAAVGAPAVASVGTCQPVNLAFALGDSSQIGQDQRTQVVDMTNHASSTCTMDGFPGVDLIGDANSQPSYDWTLTRSSATGIAKVTLRPGATAHFDLVFLSGDLASGGGSKNVMTVQKMVITTPGQEDRGDSTIQGSLDWFQDVVLQDGATHPGTYITPVAAGI
jgi:hypothetical protein